MKATHGAPPWLKRLGPCPQRNTQRESRNGDKAGKKPTAKRKAKQASEASTLAAVAAKWRCRRSVSWTVRRRSRWRAGQGHHRKGNPTLSAHARTHATGVVVVVSDSSSAWLPESADASETLFFPLRHLSRRVEETSWPTWQRLTAQRAHARSFKEWNRREVVRAPAALRRWGRTDGLSSESHGYRLPRSRRLRDFDFMGTAEALHLVLS